MFCDRHRHVRHGRLPAHATNARRRHCAARIPAPALTAFAHAEDRKKVMLAGYQIHLAKPFDIAEWCSWWQTWLAEQKRGRGRKRLTRETFQSAKGCTTRSRLKIPRCLHRTSDS